MSAPGQIARRILGRYFKPLGAAYRRVFVNLEKIIELFDRELPNGARILDIGGGDGAVVDKLLDRRPDIEVTMCDLAPSIGSFLSDTNRARVKLAPGRAFSEMPGPYDVVTISDVIHHVPLEERDSFFMSLAKCCEHWKCRKIIFKDIEPSGPRARLAFLADWHITGDKQVRPFSQSSFTSMAAEHFCGSTKSLFMPDWPNYCAVIYMN